MSRVGQRGSGRKEGDDKTYQWIDVVDPVESTGLSLEQVCLVLHVVDAAVVTGPVRAELERSCQRLVPLLRRLAVFLEDLRHACIRAQTGIGLGQVPAPEVADVQQAVQVEVHDGLWRRSRWRREIWEHRAGTRWLTAWLVCLWCESVECLEWLLPQVDLLNVVIFAAGGNIDGVHGVDVEHEVRKDELEGVEEVLVVAERQFPTPRLWDAVE